MDSRISLFISRGLWSLVSLQLNLLTSFCKHLADLLYDYPWFINRCIVFLLNKFTAWPLYLKVENRTYYGAGLDNNFLSLIFPAKTTEIHKLVDDRHKLSPLIVLFPYSFTRRLHFTK